MEYFRFPFTPIKFICPKCPMVSARYSDMLQILFHILGCYDIKPWNLFYQIEEKTKFYMPEVKKIFEIIEEGVKTGSDVTDFDDFEFVDGYSNVRAETLFKVFMQCANRSLDYVTSLKRSLFNCGIARCSFEAVDEEALNAHFARFHRGSTPSFFVGRPQHSSLKYVKILDQLHLLLSFSQFNFENQREHRGQVEEITSRTKIWKGEMITNHMERWAGTWGILCGKKMDEHVIQEALFHYQTIEEKVARWAENATQSAMVAPVEVDDDEGLFYPASPEYFDDSVTVAEISAMQDVSSADSEKSNHNQVFAINVEVPDERSASASANHTADVAPEPEVPSADDDEIENEDQRMEQDDRYDDSDMLVVAQAAGTVTTDIVFAIGAVVSDEKRATYHSADVARDPEVPSAHDDELENEDQLMEAENRFDDSVKPVEANVFEFRRGSPDYGLVVPVINHEPMCPANDEVMDTSSLDSPQLNFPEAAEPDMNEHVNALAEQARSNNSEPFEDGNTSADHAADFDMEVDRKSVSTDQNQDEYEDDMMDEEIHYDDSARLTVTQTNGNGINDNVLVEPVRIPDVMEITRAAPLVNKPTIITKDVDHETDESSADEMEVETDEEPLKRVIMTRQAARAARGNAKSTIRDQAVVTRSAAGAPRVSRSVKDPAVQATGVATRRRVIATAEAKTRNSRQAGHVGRLLYTCFEKNCKHSFEHFDDVNTHMSGHSGSDFECEVCKESFSTAALAVDHVKKRLLMNCCKCGLKLAGPSRMLDHLRSHRNELLFECKACKKRFVRPQNLEGHHRRVHYVQKDFHCDQCDKRFSTKQGLSDHKLCHTGEKPHKCRTCSFASSSRSSWRRHEDDTCKNRNKKIKKRSSKQQPLLSDSFVCEICNKVYKELASLRRHRTMKH